MKNLLLATIFAVSATPALAVANDSNTDELLRRAVGTCLVKQAVVLDDRSKSVDVVSRAIVAGCNPVIAAHVAQNKGIVPGDLARVLVGDNNSTDAIFGLDAVLTDRAASVIEWLRSSDNTSGLRIRTVNLAAK
jgi:hypothetical protein